MRLLRSAARQGRGLRRTYNFLVLFSFLLFTFGISFAISAISDCKFDQISHSVDFPSSIKLYTGAVGEPVHPGDFDYVLPYVNGFILIVFLFTYMHFHLFMFYSRIIGVR